MFRAFDPEHDRLVAVKRFQLDVPPERARDLVAAFDELIGASLIHPVIAAPVAAGLDGTVAYLASEYVAADSLDIVVREYGQAPAAEALRVATQVAGALDFAAVVHRHHGALHARDVLLSSGDTRITGIGVAAALERIGVAAPVRRPYAAPERIAGGDWDRRADIFSLAALIHELLWAKRIAGTGSAAADALQPIEGGTLPALRDLFARALAEDPRARFDTALEFAAALTAAFPHVVPAVGAPERPAAPPPVPLDDAAPAVRETSAVETRPSAVVAPAPAKREPEPALDLIVASPPPGRTEPPDFPLRAAPPPRLVELGNAPSTAPLPDVSLAPDAMPARESVRRIAPAVMDPTPEPEFMASAIEQSRSAVWPLMLALVVGIALGFAGGYSVGSHDRAAAPAPATVASASHAPAGTVAPPAGASASDRPSADVASADAPKPVPAEPPAAAPSPQTAAPPMSASEPRRADTSASKVEFAGGLLVRSTPAGARVFVDGHEYGKTPIAVRELARGQHRVRIVRDGFSTEERRVVLTTGRPTQSMIVPLVATAPARPAAPSAATATSGQFAGALTVESRPPDAKVYLDGVLIGTTPLQLPAVTAGEHAVRLEHDGYRHWSSSVRIVAAETSRVTASLEK